MNIKTTSLQTIMQAGGKIFLALILPVLIVQSNFAQTIEPAKKEKLSAELRKDAVSLLRETAADVNNMRTTENRISFSAELANLMWFDDEKEARAMFKIVITDFRALLTQFNVPEPPTDTEDEANLMIGGEGGDFNRKFFQAIAVRQQIAVNLAQHDPQMAFDFLAETAQAVTNPKLRAQMDQNAYFEMQLLTKIAEKDVDVALKYGRKKLEKDFDHQMIGLLQKIYGKDAEKGAAFGEDILKKIKSFNASSDNFPLLNSILMTAKQNVEQIKNEPGKRLLFSEQSMRELAELFAQALLKHNDLENYEIKSYLPQIEKFAPARAAQINQKIAAKNAKNRNGSGDNSDVLPVPVPNNSKTDAQKKLMEDVAGLNAKTLSKDEKQKVIEQTRKIIAEVKSRDQKLLALSLLAAQAALSGDKETATQIMDDARSLISSQPKNYRDYTESWIVASGYAAFDTDKAFPMLEDTIFRLNETIAAFVKVGEFIDTSNEIFVEDELQLGSFGGEMTRGLTRSLGALDATVVHLAKADFTRTKALTNKFDRQEVRILAKMIVLRGVLGDTPAANGDLFE